MKREQSVLFGLLSCFDVFAILAWLPVWIVVFYFSMVSEFWL